MGRIEVDIAGLQAASAHACSAGSYVSALAGEAAGIYHAVDTQSIPGGMG